MRRHACIKDNIVVKIESVSDEQLALFIQLYDMVIDIEDSVIQPSAGWTLSGNQLVAGDISSLTATEKAKIQQTNQREYGEKLAKVLVDMVGSKNLELTAAGTPPNVSSLLSALNGILGLIQTGALKTARGAMASANAAFPVYSDVFTYGINDITTFLTSNQYE